MNSFPKKILEKLKVREQNGALRQLGLPTELVDFSSNDYLGFSRNEQIYKHAICLLRDCKINQNGATGSRLLSGNHKLYATAETQIAKHHRSESALIFNSGYTANMGLLSCVPQKGDLIFYDELSHASIRDGIKLSHAKAYKFKHNDFEDLQQKLRRIVSVKNQDVYVVTEAVFSMDGDMPDFNKLKQLWHNFNCHLIIDEAHAFGVLDTATIKLYEDFAFARVVTFGKALGCHGAVVLGSAVLKSYLINFSRSFIYTTGLSPHSLAVIQSAYTMLNTSNAACNLNTNILFFKEETKRLGLSFISSSSAIQCIVVKGNTLVKRISNQLAKNGFDVKPILSPTVKKGHERLRFCVHNYNTALEITKVLEHLKQFIANK